ncbi:opioid-binding protein/cell adhesion molecule-like [Cololabis saira]|uniref:opioid-binding protein/cell adhesion molecule-like n=1 Tax=Cololabis saira TaxID=129043 RepID=UPI002AD25C98|nr:opioid-binding protein/cell adhesion molecule-like [Cololabis saira]
MADRHSYCFLITFCVTGVLAGDWSVHIPSSPICAVVGSSVVLPCSYDYPQSSNETRGEGPLPSQVGAEEGQEYNVVSEMWCLEHSKCITERYVFHSAGIFPDPSYQYRVTYLGQPGHKNCSLKISDLKQSDSGTYVFYLISSHPAEKMPAQRGIQLLVAESASAVAAWAGPSVITEGADLRLACCSLAAGPQARFRWYKSTNTRLMHSGQMWNVSDVKSDTSGSYYCQIQTGDREQKSKMLNIDVQYPPRSTAVVVWPAAEVQTELPVYLSCSSDANPPVHTFTWYQGAACLQTAHKSFHQGQLTPANPTGRGSTLNSANMTTQEPGQHCCVARNKHGSQTYSVTLRDSRAITPSDSSGNRVVLIGVTVGVLVAIVAIAAFLIMRRQTTTRRQSYVLTETAATEP